MERQRVLNMDKVFKTSDGLRGVWDLKQSLRFEESDLENVHSVELALVAARTKRTDKDW